MKHIYYHYHKLQFHPDRYLPTRIYLFGCEPICGLNPFQAVRSGHIKKITHHLIVTGASMCVVSHPAIIDQVCSSSPPFPPSSPPSLLPLPLPPLFSSCSTTSSSSFRFLLLPLPPLSHLPSSSSLWYSTLLLVDMYWSNRVSTVPQFEIAILDH